MRSLSQKVIEWSFYLLFFFVPLVFYAGSFELFEYNKMMLTYALTIIVTAAWLIKLIGNFQFSIFNWIRSIPRTPLDIPILLYLGAHILSTIFSLDRHVSIWGYYSRFHEGLLATISYIILYYAAVSNLKREHILRIIFVSLASAVIVSLWGAFEHFDHSPSCLAITGRFDVDCWVQDVKNRVFATLGQPNWMAAYLDVVILASLGLLVTRMKSYVSGIILPALFFSALLFTKSRSGILGLFAGLAVLASVIGWQLLKKGVKLNPKPLLILVALFALLALLFGLPFSQTEGLSLETFLSKKPTTMETKKPDTSGYIDVGISQSSDIRRIVWSGALKIWQRYPIFGSGVETFAYAYYKDRPVAHNMVSEWDFLYNKAHNEFLNILATTGSVGMLAFLSIIAVFCLWFLRSIVRKTSDQLIPTLFAAWISILVTNFFGFSVVIIGLFFFLLPAFCFILSDLKDFSPPSSKLATSPPWLPISLIILVSLILEFALLTMWQADRAFAYGKNLDSIQQFVSAYPFLKRAVATNSSEPTFRDELSFNQSLLAAAIFGSVQQASDSAIASLSAQEKRQIKIPLAPGVELSTNDLIKTAIADSDKVVTTSPNSLPFWKTRTKVFYELGTIDPKYFADALTAIQRAAELAPTDAKVHYNLGVILGRNGDISGAIKALEETIAAKPDYRDAYYSLGLYYNIKGDRKKAREEMQLILKLIGPDEQAQKWLEENR